LKRLTTVHDPTPAQVRAQEHGAIPITDQERLERRLVQDCKQANGHVALQASKRESTTPAFLIDTARCRRDSFCNSGQQPIIRHIFAGALAA
jgi:hypothetical protein